MPDKTYRTEQILKKTGLSKSGLRWRKKSLGIRPKKHWVSDDVYWLVWSQDDLDRLMEFGAEMKERNNG